MIIFLYGQDTYRSYQKMNEIVDRYKKSDKSGFNLKYFDFEKDDYESFRNEIKIASIFTGKKLIILRNSVLNENFQINFLKDSKKLISSKDIILFYENKDIPAKNKILKFLKTYAKSQEFKLLEGKQLRDWAEEEFESRGITIGQEALEKLIIFTGNDLWQLRNETQKLIAYRRGQKIEASDIELLVRPKIEIDIFETIDAIAAKNKKKVYSLLYQHLEKGDSPLYLFSMINFQFRNLLMIKSQEHKPYYLPEISKKLGMHPYVIKKAIVQSKNFSLNELKEIYQKIFWLDLAIKTGKADAQTALDLLITKI